MSLSKEPKRSYWNEDERAIYVIQTKTIDSRPNVRPLTCESSETVSVARAVFTWLSKGIGFGFGFGFTTPFGWLVYLLWFWFYDSQVKTALNYAI